MIIKEPLAAFLQKAFCHGIDRNEQLQNPEQTIPYTALRLFNSHVQYKNGSPYIQKHAVKRVLLADFKEYVLFKKRPDMRSVVQRKYVTMGF